MNTCLAPQEEKLALKNHYTLRFRKINELVMGRIDCSREKKQLKCKLAVGNAVKNWGRTILQGGRVGNVVERPYRDGSETFSP